MKFKSTHCEQKFISIQDIFVVSMMYKISYDVHDLFFCFNKYGPTLLYLKLEKKLTHLDIGSLREMFLFHTKKLRTFIYVNGYKFATF